MGVGEGSGKMKVGGGGVRGVDRWEGGGQVEGGWRRVVGLGRVG